MSEELFNHPEVKKVIRAILVSKGMRSEQELEDGVADVVLACIEEVRAKKKQPPKDVAEAKAFARPVAGGDGMDAARKRNRRGVRNVDSTGTPDDYADEPASSMDPIDRKRALEAVAEVVPAHKLELLADVSAGAKRRELAAEHSISGSAMGHRLGGIFKTARGALVAKGFGALLAIVILLVVGARWRANDQEAHNQPPDVPSSRSVPTQVPVDQLSPPVRAAGYRNRADGYCKTRNWDLCEKALDKAQEIDPASEASDQARELREVITLGRAEDTASAADAGVPSFGAKPGAHEAPRAPQAPPPKPKP
jgi:hypothetical protein